MLFSPEGIACYKIRSDIHILQQTYIYVNINTHECREKFLLLMRAEIHVLLPETKFFRFLWIDFFPLAAIYYEQNKKSKSERKIFVK